MADEKIADAETASTTVVDDVRANAQSFLEGVAGKMVQDSFGADIIEPGGEESEPAEAETPVPESAPENDPSQTDALEGVSPEETEDEPAEPQDDGGVDPKVQEKIDRRIAKEVAKTKAAEEKLVDLQEQLTALKSRIDGGESKQPSEIVSEVANAQTPDQLAKLESQAEQVVDYAENLLDRIDDNPDAVENELKRLKAVSTDHNGVEDWSQESMKRTLREFRRNAAKTLKEVPKRMAFLDRQAASEQKAVSLMPELADANSDRFKRFNIALRNVPQLRSHPQWPEMAALIVMGAESVSKTKTQPAPVRPKAEKPPKLPTGGSGAAAVKPAAGGDEGIDPALVSRVFDPNASDREARTEYIQRLLDKSKG